MIIASFSNLFFIITFQIADLVLSFTDIASVIFQTSQ